MLEKTSDFAEQNVGKLEEPADPQKTETPSKLRQTRASKDSFFNFGESKWKREHMEALDLVCPRGTNKLHGSTKNKGWFPLRVNSEKILCFSIQFYTRSVFARKMTSNRQTKNIYAPPASYA